MKKVLLTVLALAAIAAPTAIASPPDGGEHKVTICHFTGSETNPFVVITVDNNAYTDNPAGMGHNPPSHQESSDPIWDGTCDEKGGGGDPKGA